MVKQLIKFMALAESEQTIFTMDENSFDIKKALDQTPIGHVYQESSTNENGRKKILHVTNINNASADLIEDSIMRTEKQQPQPDNYKSLHTKRVLSFKKAST